MKNWAIEKNGKIWIPSIITLPIGMLYPVNMKKKMKWAFAPMVEITEEERREFPNPNGGYYEKRIDTDNPIIYDKFIEGMTYINDLLKQKDSSGE